MKIHLRADEANGTHTKVTVFMNSANCGQLTFREEEAIFFHGLVTRSKYLIPSDDVVTSGKWFLNKDETGEDYDN